MKLATIIETPNMVLVQLITCLLDKADIPYLTQNEGLATIVVIQVPESFEKEALTIIQSATTERLPD